MLRKKVFISRKIIILFLLLINSSFYVAYGGTSANVKRTIHVNQAGTLSDLISDSEKYIIEELTLTGELNGTDFRLLRDMGGTNYKGEITPGVLTLLDLTDSRIVAGGEMYLDANSITYSTENGKGVIGNSFHCSVEQDNTIPLAVFAGCKFKSICLPKSVISIEEKAFLSCWALADIVIPDGVTTIGNQAFSSCRSLSGVNLPESMTDIGSNAFSYCSNLTSIRLPDNINQIGSHAFFYCSKLKTIDLPQKLENINICVFSYCTSLASITIPSNVTWIRDLAFENCSALNTLIISQYLSSISSNAFDGCRKLNEIEVLVTDFSAFCDNRVALAIKSKTGKSIKLIDSNGDTIKDFVIPNDVTKIGSYAFNYCSCLSSVIIPSNVTSIGYASFEGCTGFRSIEIPNSISSIDKKAFFGCSNLSPVLSKITNPKKIDTSVFEGIPSNAVLQVPKGTKEAYLKTDSWGTHFQEIVEEGCCNMTIKVTGMGDVSYNNYYIHDQSITFSVEKGESVTLSIIPDIGYKIKKLLVNGYNRTSYVTNNQYTISNISAKTNIEVEFEAVSYSLTITAIGNGTVTYEGNIINGKTSSFNTTYGSSATILFSADDGYKLKSIKLNNKEITSSIDGNQYTISNIKADNSIEVTFEAKPDYTLNIVASGNGNASYGDITIRNQSQSFTLQEDASATILFTPDDCHRVKSVMDNEADVTSKVTDNSYTIREIKANTTLAVTFEICTHKLSIKSSGIGSVSYNNTAIREGTNTFFVNEGTSATMSFIPDEGYRIKCVKVNELDVTSDIENNKYTINNIREEIAVDVVFEAIPTYSLNIVVSGNGSASYNGTTIRNQSKNFTVFEGSSPIISITPDSRNRIKSVKMNNVDVTAQVANGQVVINNIMKNSNVEITFEELPPTPYSLNISVTGNGSVLFDGNTVRDNVSSFTVLEGTDVTVTFSPDAGFRLKSVKLNNVDVTSSVANNQYTISNVTADTTLEVVFEVITHTLSITASGNGSVTYNSIAVRGKTQTFTVNEGTSVTVTFVPDTGYRIVSVKVNDIDVTSDVTNNKYTIENIEANTTLVVTFEAITHTLTIKATGNGKVTFNESVIRDETNSFAVNEGTSAIVKFAPDAGNNIKSVKLNGADITANIINSQYTISNIKNDNTLEVEFEAITHTLSITASGNGNVTYNNTDVRENTQSFIVNEGTSATVIFAPDAGYRIASVKLNNIDVTESVVDNSYTINNINSDCELSIVFENITHTLTIASSGNGKTMYNDKTIRGEISLFTVNEGSSATISFTPDEGCRIAYVKINTTDATSQVVYGQITISNIAQDTNVEVVFEEIPLTTYSLSITAIGNGSVIYDENTIRSKTSEFTVVEGSYITMQLSADDGYRLKSITLNGQDVTENVVNNQYTTPKIMADAALVVVFEAIPTFALTVKSSAFGSVKFGDVVVSNRTETFSVREGTSATMTFTPDDNGRLHSITLNGTDITKELVNGQYTISDIRADQSIEAEFVEDITKVTDAGVAYTVTSYDNQTVVVAEGNYGNVLTVPASFTAKEKTWTVVGIDEDALKDNTALAAIIWNPEVAFTAKVSNRNLLLYVKDAQYAPATIQNVVVNNQAENIVLVEAASGNDFYCPQAFTAKRISYEHNYSMISGYKTCQGWETLVLPFDVTMMINAKGQELTPYINWQYGNSQRPFWLYEMTTQGWKAGSGIKANTPYIISMPNNEMYDVSFNQTGNIQFIGTNVEVKASTDMMTGQHGNKRLVANYQTQEASADIYALNVSNEWSQNTATEAEGSTFIRSLRSVHPFEAYLTVEGSNARAIPVFDNATDVRWLLEEVRGTMAEDAWYDLQGRKLQGEPKQNGIYIYKGKKVKK